MVEQIKAVDSLFTIPLLIVAFMVDIFLLVDGNAVLGSQFSLYQPTLTIYLAMDSIMLGATKFVPEIKISFMSAMLFFVPAFVITVLIMGSYTGTVNLDNTKALGFQYYITQILLQVFVVALSEELLFRGIAEKYFGWIVQGILFGLFHIEAYQLEGFSWTGVFIAMVFGLLMGYIVKVFSERGKTSDGIAVTWGIHAGWNVAIILGVFALGAVI